MAGRSIRAIVVSLVVAIMVGIREGTGIAPPPPTLNTEEIEWLSPEPENDHEALVVFEDPTSTELKNYPGSDIRPQYPLVSFAKAILRRLGVRRG